MSIKIANAFSIQMLASMEDSIGVGFRKLTPKQVNAMMDGAGVESYIGDDDTAAVVSDLIGVEVPCNRGFLKLHSGESIIVAQITGGRLPEGATTLPDGFNMDFWLVHVS